MKDLNKKLKNGEIIIFDNELFCEENQSDDFRVAECKYYENIKHSWANGYKIQFNGTIVSYKTFTSFKRKLDQLMERFNLSYNESSTFFNN